MSSPVLESNSSALAARERTSLWIAHHHLAILVLLGPFVLLVHGYHPFADDAGIYVAGIRKMLDPSLFRIDSGFVVAHTRLSIFSHLFAWTIKLFHIPLELGLFAAYLLSIFLFLLGCLRLSRRIFEDPQLQWGATLLASALFTLPVAATALWVMDPYVTARSFSTPLSLFAIAACLDHYWKRAGLWLAVVTALHPLMAMYLGGFLLAYFLISTNRRLWLVVTAFGAFVAAGVVYFATRHSALPEGYREAALTRTYFFLSFWQWYEVLGLVMPLLLMAVAAWRTGNPAVRNLCLACLATGATASAIAAGFVHTSGSLFLARIQPLRSFQLVYLVGILLLGAFFAEHLRGRRIPLGAALLLMISGAMMFAQTRNYTASAHVEWPFAVSRNPWQQAFLWIRKNTPKDAVFAPDSSYTKVASEDTQGFRATAVRSALVDELKDGGVVAIFPDLAPGWKRQRDLERGLDQASDQERISRLRPMGVTWVLLTAGAKTRFDCPFRNEEVLVCRLP